MASDDVRLADKDRRRLAVAASEYLRLGLDALNHYAADFDIAYDALSCYAPVTAQDMELLRRDHPRLWTLPLTATQIQAMASYIAQLLFGRPSPWRVEPRGAEDEVPAELMNQLLRWNAERQPTFLLGWLWVVDTLVANRGIFYHSWAPLRKIVTRSVPATRTVALPTGETVEVPDVDTVREEARIGDYVRIDVVSPYDFVCDPVLPLWRLQEMRFCGHRTLIPFNELLRRSRLPADHPAHVWPDAVAYLKERLRGGGDAFALLPSGGSAVSARARQQSRTAFLRNWNYGNLTGFTGDKRDRGTVECWELWIRLIPADYNLGPEDFPVLFQFLVAAGNVLLSVNRNTYDHNEYPYAVAEGRPSNIAQFGQSWAGLLKGLQDYVDWLKNRHQMALSRTVGNIFLFDPDAVDVEDFLNPDKEGLLLPLKPGAFGRKLDEVVRQIPLKDFTERFINEMSLFYQYSEAVTGVNQAVQGTFQIGEPSATQFAGTQQMAAGRLATVARMLATQALVPQTRQIVSMFQQFLTEPMEIRFQPTSTDLPPELLYRRSVSISRDTIQGEFDFVPFDETLPGTDTRKVAAMVRLLEAVSAFPQLASGQPGSLDVRRLVLEAARASGLTDVERFMVTPATAPATAPFPPATPAPQSPGPAGPLTSEVAPEAPPDITPDNMRPLGGNTLM